MKCPSCAGPHLTPHPGGPLVFQHRLTCPLLPALDRTQAHEAEYLERTIIRAPNESEKTLAVHLDPSLAGTDFLIRCRRVTESIINREITTGE